MNKRFYLYGLLVAFTICQAVLMRHTLWVPDFILLLVVFTGIFWGSSEGIKFGLLAGFLRGSFSIYTLPLDIFIFPLIGSTSAALAKRFYRNNPVIEGVITMIAFFMVIAFHTFYLKIISGNHFIGVWSVFLGSSRTAVITICLSPLLFFLLRGIGKQEE